MEGIPMTGQATEADRAMLAAGQQHDRMLQFFEYAHLPERLQEISKEFFTMAHWIAMNLPSNPERTVALRKLLEAKDCAVRARLFK
jgi:hypothetical protein